MSGYIGTQSFSVVGSLCIDWLLFGASDLACLGHVGLLLCAGDHVGLLLGDGDLCLPPESGLEILEFLPECEAGFISL